MKIIGLMPAWACEDWIEYAIKQALDIVDELIISIGAYNQYFNKLEDNTYNFAKKYFNDKKVKYVKSFYDPLRDERENNCRNTNRMLQASDNIEIGNIIWLLDADEFYSRESIKEILNFINSNEEFDYIENASREFLINMDYYVNTIHGRLWKITNKNCYFVPTHKIIPPPKKPVVLLKDNPMFHYSLLIGEQYKITHWTLDNNYISALWYKKIYENYEPNREKYWMKKNEDLTGKYGFWFDNLLIEKNGHGVFKYEGKHPELIENSELRSISDFRIYTKTKPNYLSYRKFIKQLILDKKREYMYKRIPIYIINLKLWKNYLSKLVKFRNINIFLKNYFNKLKKFIFTKLFKT